jgi:hypothetical protein
MPICTLEPYLFRYSSTSCANVHEGCGRENCGGMSSCVCVALCELVVQTWLSSSDFFCSPHRPFMCTRQYALVHAHVQACTYPSINVITYMDHVQVWMLRHLNREKLTFCPMERCVCVRVRQSWPMYARLCVYSQPRE